MSLLPAASSAFIAPAKLTYLLNSGKARFFLLHGFDPGRPQELDLALRGHPVRNPVESWSRSMHGTKYVIRCSIVSPDGRNPCMVTVWIVDTSRIEPRFVTGYASPVTVSWLDAWTASPPLLVAGWQACHPQISQIALMKEARGSERISSFF